MYQIRYLVQLLATSLSVFLFLSMFAWSSYIINLSVAVLSFKIAAIVLQFQWHVLPATLLPTQDKAVLITGCDTGFGNMLAKELDKKGVKVFACCLYPEGKGVLELKKKCSDKLKILHLDVTKPDHIKAAMKEVTESLGEQQLWALVNNAGIISISEAELVSMNYVQKLMDVNLYGHIRVTSAFLPFIRRSKGRIIFTCSIVAYTAPIATSTYAMSKAALKSYAESLRREMIRWSVSVHTIDPTGYRTQMTNIESLLTSMTNQWNDVSQDLRSEYGHNDYRNGMKELITNWLKICESESKLNEVVECMLDAAIGKYPKMQYFTGLTGQLTGWLLLNLPTELIDIVSQNMIPNTLRRLAF